MRSLHWCYISGHQPLSWTARAYIALDAARGIEYIHDLTNTRYVHRDIKTSNILLDQVLRAKVLISISSISIFQNSCVLGCYISIAVSISLYC